MFPFPVFEIGDLVRKRSLLSKSHSGYGVIVLMMPRSIKCIWSDNTVMWVQPSELYLIARGQGGIFS